MKQQQASQSAPTVTLPKQVWVTLTPTQQTTVLQALVQLCHQLVVQWNQEKKDEPISD
jgi:hypothetical protein